jgi:hypothetical protein
MSLTLEEALGQVELEPGRTYRTVVNGNVIDVRVRPTPTPPDPPSDDSPGVMLNVWLDIPPSPNRKKFVAKRRTEPRLPDPPLPDPDDAPDGTAT